MKTRKVRKPSKKSTTGHIINFFLTLINTIKIYHWKTTSYSQHKATDDLFSKLQDNVDKFMEVYLGKNPRFKTNDVGSIHLTCCDNLRDLKTLIEKCIKKLPLIDLSPSNDTDLLNIRDEILADLNQFLYLLTLK